MSEVQDLPWTRPISSETLSNDAAIDATPMATPSSDTIDEKSLEDKPTLTLEAHQPITTTSNNSNSMRNATPEEKEAKGIAATSMLRLLDLSSITTSSGVLDSDILISGRSKPLSAREENSSPRAESRRVSTLISSSRRGSNTNIISNRPPSSAAAKRSTNSQQASQPSDRQTALATHIAPITESEPPSPEQIKPSPAEPSSHATFKPAPEPKPSALSLQPVSKETFIAYPPPPPRLPEASIDDLGIRGKKERLRGRDTSPEASKSRDKGTLSYEDYDALDLSGLDDILSHIPSPLMPSSKTKKLAPSPPTLQLSPYSLVDSFPGLQLVSPCLPKLSSHTYGDKKVNEALEKWSLHQNFNSHVVAQHEKQKEASLSPSSSPAHSPLQRATQGSPTSRPQTPPTSQDPTMPGSMALGAYLTHGAFGGSIPIKADVERGVMFERHGVDAVNPHHQPFLRNPAFLQTSKTKQASNGLTLPATVGGNEPEVVALNSSRARILPNGVPTNRLETARVAKEARTAAVRRAMIFGHKGHGLASSSSQGHQRGRGSSSPSPSPPPAHTKSHPSVPLLSFSPQNQLIDDEPMQSPGAFGEDTPTETPRLQAHSVVLHKAMDQSLGLASSSGQGGSFSVKKKSQSLRRGGDPSSRAPSLPTLAASSTSINQGSPAKRAARILESMDSPTLNSKTSEPILDESFFRQMKGHFQQTAIDQKVLLQKSMNGSLGTILSSFGVRHVGDN